MNKSKILLVATLVISLLIGVIGLSCRRAPQLLEPYKLGVVNNTTGWLGIFGIAQIDGINLAAEVINKQGGVNGHPLVITWYDGESKADVNARMARKVIEADKVDVMIGPNFTPGIAAIAPLVNEGKIPMMKFGGYVVNPAKDPWIFSMGSDNFNMAQGMVEYYTKKGYKKIAFLAVRNAFGEEFLKGYQDYLPKYPDVKILGLEWMMPEDTDITVQMTKLIALNPDVIATSTAGTTAIMAVRTAKTLGFKGPVGATHADSSIAFAGAIKDHPAGSALVPTRSGTLPQYTEAMPAGAPKEYGLKIMEQWKAKFGSYKDVEMGSWGYEFVDIYAQAMRKVGKDRAAIKNWLETNTILTSSGYLKMSPTDHRGSDPKEWVAILTVKDGQFIAAP